MKMRPVARGAVRSGRRERTLWLVFLLITAAFWVTNHNWDYPINVLQEPDARAEHVAEGSTIRRTVFPVLGLWGLVMLMRTRTRMPQVADAVGFALVFLAVWASLSVVWSMAPALTVRRLVSYAAFALAATALAARMPTRDLGRFIGLSTGIYLVLGVVSEIAHGTFQPHMAGFRLQGTQGHNSYAINCSLFVLSSLYLRNATPSSRRLFSLFTVAGLVLLVLTRSRTSFAALLVAVVAYLYLATPEVEKKVVAIILCGVLLMGVVVIGDASAVRSGLFLGRASEGNLDTLNGRLWVWMACRGYAGQRPVAGYGFQGFWTPDRIREFSTNQGWTLGSAHSIYVDMVLNLGMVGFLAFAVLLVLSMRKVLVRARRVRDPAPAFLFAFLVYYCLHGLLESVFINPGYFVFASMIIFAKIAFFPIQSDEGAEDATGDRRRRQHLAWQGSGTVTPAGLRSSI